MAPLNLTERQELERLRKTPDVQQYKLLWTEEKDILWSHIDETDPPLSKEENQQIKVLDEEIKLLEKKHDVSRYRELSSRNVMSGIDNFSAKFRQAAHICSGNSKEEFTACMAEQLGKEKLPHRNSP
jgi:multidrug resistance efflux pump